MKNIRNRRESNMYREYHVVLESTLYIYIAAPMFIVLAFASPWWLIGTVPCFVAGWMIGRERWRRVLAAAFVLSLIWSAARGALAAMVVAWWIGYMLTAGIDAFLIHLRLQESMDPPFEEEEED